MMNSTGESRAVAEARNRGSILAAKIAYRAYLATMRFQSMAWVPIRRHLVNIMIGGKSRNLQIFPNVFLDGILGLRIGHHVSINRGSNISAMGGLSIGDYVAIGHSTSILTTNHGFADRETPIKYQPVSTAPVTIGSNVWVGANVTILAGVEIADGTVIAAGAVVTKSSLEPDMIIAGVPARPIKSRLSQNAGSRQSVGGSV